MLAFCFIRFDEIGIVQTQWKIINNDKLFSVSWKEQYSIHEIDAIDVNKTPEEWNFAITSKFGLQIFSSWVCSCLFSVFSVPLCTSLRIFCAVYSICVVCLNFRLYYIMYRIWHYSSANWWNNFKSQIEKQLTVSKIQW